MYHDNWICKSSDISSLLAKVRAETKAFETTVKGSRNAMFLSSNYEASNDWVMFFKRNVLPTVVPVLHEQAMSLVLLRALFGKSTPRPPQTCVMQTLLYGMMPVGRVNSISACNHERGCSTTSRVVAQRVR